jgi:TPR repeat protein
MSAPSAAYIIAVIALAGCEDKKAREAQEKLDRQIEQAGGIERDKNGRAYNGSSGKYLDSRGGKVTTSERVEGASIDELPKALPPDPPETDVTRGEVAEFHDDKAGAAKLYKKACDDKVAGGCAHLAMMHREGGGGIKKDPKLAEKKVKELCDAGDGYACYGLGIIYETTYGDKTEEIIALYDKGCTLKSIDACNALGMLYHSGRSGAPKDKDKAAAALRRGCELGDRMSCLQINMVKSGAP